MKQLAPSILSADFGRLNEQIDILKNEGCEWLHMDIMDGMFVPSISFGMPVVAALRPASDLFFDVHMMVEDPGRYVDAMKKAGADLLCVHAEACTHIDRVLASVHDAGMKAGIALNPATPLCVLDYIMDKVDMVLIMSVNPGFSGQKFIPAMTAKVAALKKKLVDAGYPDVLIEVDGGMNVNTIPEIKAAGADVFVAGSAAFSGDVAENFRKLNALIQE